MRLLVVASACALAACATHDGAIPVSDSSTQQSGIAAPTPNEVAIRIGQAQAGTTVRVPVGQRFAVQLVGVPTAGYVWKPEIVPDFLDEAGEASGPTSQAQMQPGFTGGSHWEVLMFTANAAGSGELVLAQRRPWETDEPAAQTFRVTIEAY